MTARSAPCPTRPALSVLIERARNHVMTNEEMHEQRVSWVRGELMMQHPDMTREEADKLVREAAK